VAEPTFSEVVDWLSEREGKEVYIEVGTKDPTAATLTDYYPVAIHATLGNPQIGENADHEHRGIIYLPLVGMPERSRLYIDSAAVTEIKFHGDALRIVFHDSIYLGFSGS
jgi:hypothetical protein